MKRSKLEWAFICCFVPGIILFYTYYKYPALFVGENADTRLLGKNLGFWYALVYTSVVCGIAAKVLLKGKNVYSMKKVVVQALSPYQKKKFTSIFFVQLFGFFLIPYAILPLTKGGSFWSDIPSLPAKAAHVYLYPAFKSWGMAAYIFLVIPVGVWFFGKRYCSWICSCGNLADRKSVV